MTYRLGDIGPGGGLVFLISGGRTYEMAPKAWGPAAAVDPTGVWRNNSLSDVTDAVDTAVGTVAANTTAMIAACTSGASRLASGYDGGGLTDWFLPSKDELNAMCQYSRNPTTPAAPAVACGSTHDGTFSIGPFGFPFGFADNNYRSSTQGGGLRNAWLQTFDGGYGGHVYKGDAWHIRPVRAF